MHLKLTTRSYQSVYATESDAVVLRSQRGTLAISQIICVRLAKDRQQEIAALLMSRRYARVARGVNGELLCLTIQGHYQMLAHLNREAKQYHTHHPSP
jgi:CobQ-like glutamine amidotransferase family enzyme